MAESIRINFGKPFPLFPLPEAVLLPHAILPLHVFEPRYRRMVNDSLDQAGQIAMATFASRKWSGPAGEMPPLRPAVCIGQIVQHEALQDGRHNILLHGVCRARIVTLCDDDEKRGYHRAELAPLERPQENQPALTQLRQELRCMLAGPRLSRMRSVDTIREWFDREDIPTQALIELIGFTLVKNNELKYRLLAEGDPRRRADLIKQELRGLDHLVCRAERQNFAEWPKGMSWN
ncbi:MAG TPA: LON peptidase substrate-binding domain-containing protein [Phycisphaerales bacterium]|nr:LON peptidase substrate-binding domain-containing protein [Phycisphaerales bacterium]HRQ76736.1 LON peptidase substrate-binding domain-containing protein [Phycisphaerales bacterium]